MTLRKTLEIGGFIAGAIMIAFGVAVIALGLSGRSTVNSNLKQQQIVGSSDMTPAAIKDAAAKAGLTDAQVGSFPSCSVADVTITSGSQARCFAQYMQIHALEASGGLFYAQMGRFATPDGKPAGTNDATKAVMADGQPVANAARNTWVTETALTSALNMSYMAAQLSLFSIVVGIALLLSGVGFLILDWAALHRRREATEKTAREAAALQPGKPAVA